MASHNPNKLTAVAIINNDNKSTQSICCFLVLVGCFLTHTTLAEEHAGSTPHAPFKPTHSVGLAIGHARVFEGVDANGNLNALVLPIWGIDYNFQFAPKWMVGLHTDLIVETFFC